MGERIAIKLVRKAGNYGAIGFAYPQEESVVMYSHWDGDGLAFLHCIQRYLRGLPPIPENGTGPIDRREPSSLVVDFLRGDGGSMVDRLQDSTQMYKWLDHGFWAVDVFTGKATQLDKEEK